MDIFFSSWYSSCIAPPVKAWGEQEEVIVDPTKKWLTSLTDQLLAMQINLTKEHLRLLSKLVAQNDRLVLGMAKENGFDPNVLVKSIEKSAEEYFAKAIESATPAKHQEQTQET